MPAWRGPRRAPPVFALKARVHRPRQPGPRARRASGDRHAVRRRDRRADRDPGRLRDHRDPHRRGQRGRDRALARPDARMLAILGAGVQGRAHLRALTLVREFDQVRVYSRTEAHARELTALGRIAASGCRVAGAPRRRSRTPTWSCDRDQLARAGAEPRLAEAGRARQRGRREQPGGARARHRHRGRERAVLRQPRVAAQRGRRVPARDRARARSPARSMSAPSWARCSRESRRGGATRAS